MMQDLSSLRLLLRESRRRFPAALAAFVRLAGAAFFSFAKWT